MEPFSIKPVSRKFGFDRGKPIDRYYIENFLNQHRQLIKGNVLEIGDDFYTEQFGTNVQKSDVLDIKKSKYTTIVGNLETGENVPVNEYDCFILTQVIHVIYDYHAVIQHSLNTLKPGGVLLLTTTGLSQSCKNKHYGDYWRFTDESLQRTLEQYVNQKNIDINSFGNVAVAKAFLDGLSLQELPANILDVNDPNYQVVLTALITKD